MAGSRRVGQWVIVIRACQRRLAISDRTGRDIAVSDATKFANWIQLRVPNAAQLTINVTLTSVWDTDPKPVTAGYRLIVTGTTPWISATDI
jgi:hypothetical protein